MQDLEPPACRTETDDVDTTSEDEQQLLLGCDQPRDDLHACLLNKLTTLLSSAEGRHAFELRLNVAALNRASPSRRQIVLGLVRSRLTIEHAGAFVELIFQPLDDACSVRVNEECFLNVQLRFDSRYVLDFNLSETLLRDQVDSGATLQRITLASSNLAHMSMDARTHGDGCTLDVHECSVRLEKLQLALVLECAHQ